MSVSGLVRREDYDAMVHQRDEWRALYLECCDLLAKARSEHRPVTYQPCPRHAGMSMVFTTTHTARAAMPVCPGCHPPPNLVRDGSFGALLTSLEPPPILVCRERDGQCPTPVKCRADGCPLESPSNEGKR
jgi:hypothetical protein